MRDQYGDKIEGYFTQTRRDLIAMVPPNPAAKVLEIGCGRGHTLMALKAQGLASEVVGVELVDLARTAAEMRGVDRYIVGNIETDPLDLPAGYFDVVICGDVLEHLYDPWAVVDKLRTLLKPGGVMVASVPNVREVRTLFNIIVRGDFAYTESGVLDRTHVRFFCKRNILQLLCRAGGRVERIGSDLQFKSNWRARLNGATFGKLEEFLVTQYLVVLRTA